MTNSIVPGASVETFTFHINDTDGFDVRAIQINGDPWFVASDVCAALTIGNTSMALDRLDDDEKGISSIDTLGGSQIVSTISESGLYSLVLGSRKSEARRFKKWVTSEVLPAIRKTGRYETPGAQVIDPMKVLNDPATMRGLLLVYTEKVLALECVVAGQAPKVAAFDRFATVVEGSMCLTNAAKTLQIQPKRFILWMQEHQWIYRRAGGSCLTGYQTRIQSGHLEHKVTTVDRSDGTSKQVEQVLVTAKGLAKLATELTHQ